MPWWLADSATKGRVDAARLCHARIRPMSRGILYFWPVCPACGAEVRLMDSLSERLCYASEQVRRLRADGDSTALYYWYAHREDLLDQLSAQVKARVDA